MRNRVVLYGTLKNAYIQDDEQYYVFETRRLSGVVDQIHVKNKTKISLSPGVNFTVIGELGSRPLTNNKSMLVVNALEINRENSALENYCIYTGLVTRIPKMRKTPYGKEITELYVSTEDSFGKEVKVVSLAWYSGAYWAEANISTGDFVTIEGRIQTREYNCENDGCKKYFTEVCVDSILIEDMIN